MGYSVEKSTSSAWVTLGYALAYNLGALLGVALAFAVGHQWPIWWRMLAPKQAVGQRVAFVKPFNSFLRTARKVISATEDDVIRNCGVDAAVYVRYFTMCIQMFLLLVVTVFPVLLAIYSQGANPDGVQGVNQVSLSNVQNKSVTMWVTFGMLYLLSFLVYYLCWRHTLHVLHLRKKFFLRPERSHEPHNYAIAVTCIPPDPASTSAVLSTSPLAAMASGDVGPTTGLMAAQQPSNGSFSASAVAAATGERPGAMTFHDILSSLGDLLGCLGTMVPCLHSCMGSELQKRDWQRAQGMRDQLLLSGSRSVEGSRSGAHVTGEVALACEGGSTPPPPPILEMVHDEGAPQGRESSRLVGLSGPRPSLRGGSWHMSRRSAAAGEESFCSSIPAFQEFALPGEPLCPPHIAQFFEMLFPNQVLHIQPVYSEAKVAGAYKHWRHAIRMLNESRMKWEEAKKRAAEAAKAASGQQEGPEQLPQGKEKEEGNGGATAEESTAALGDEPHIRERASKQEQEQEDLKPRSRINKKWFFFGGEEVESIPYWIDQVKAAAKGLREAQEDALANPIPTSVIVVFKTRKAAALCREALKPRGRSAWKGLQASPVAEMWWDNLRLGSFQDNFRTFWATIMTIIMTIFFYIPVTLIASLATGQLLSTDMGSQKQEVQYSWLPPALQAIVPSLALHSVLWIFSPVFMLIARWEGRISLSDAMIVSSSRFYYVTVINVLIAYSLTSSLFEELYNVVNGQTTMLKVLATCLPANSAFYIQYTLNSSLMCGMELGRLPIHICGYVIKYFLIGKTYCDRERHWDQGPMAYHVFIGYMNLIVTYGIVYAVLAPLILPFSLLYILIAYFTWKHELMFIYKDPVDRGGVYWMHLIHHTLNALILGQVTTIGMLSLKQAYTQMGLCCPSIILSILCYVWLSRQYGAAFAAEPLDLLSQQREGEQGNEASGNPLVKEPWRLANAYFPEFMKPPVLPDLDPNAPSDPDIWWHMHPTRHLYDRDDYFPTPMTTAGREEGAKTLETDEPGELAFWQLTQVVDPPKTWLFQRRGKRGQDGKGQVDVTETHAGQEADTKTA